MEKLKKRCTGFTQVSNKVICSSDLSCKAKAVYCYLFSRPDDWVFHRHEIVSNFRESLNTILSALDELEQFGVLEKQRMRRHDGTLGGNYYYLDTEIKDNPSNNQKTNAGESNAGKTNAGESNAGKTNAGFLTPNNTNTTNTEKTNTDKKLKNTKREKFDFNKHVTDMWYSEAKRIKPEWTDPFIQETMESFNDYWVGEGKVKADWLATWRNWVRKSYNKPQQQKTYSNQKLSASQMDWDKI